MKYIVVGGTPFTMYTGTTTYTSIREFGQFKTEEESEQCIVKNYEECGGLIQVFKVE